MNALIIAVIGGVSVCVGFLLGVLFVCLVESGRERRHAPWQAPREREVLP